HGAAPSRVRCLGVRIVWYVYTRLAMSDIVMRRRSSPRPRCPTPGDGRAAAVVRPDAFGLRKSRLRRLHRATVVRLHRLRPTHAVLAATQRLDDRCREARHRPHEAEERFAMGVRVGFRERVGAMVETLPQEPDPLVDVIVEADLALETITRLRSGCVGVADLVEQVVDDSHGLVVLGGEGAVVRHVVSPRVGQELVATTERELLGVEDVTPAEIVGGPVLAARTCEQRSPGGPKEREMEMPRHTDAAARRAPA